MPGRRAGRPVRLQAWVEGRRVLDTRLRSAGLATAAVRMPVGLKQIVLDLEASRTVRPRDLDPASQDDRRLGALVAWSFAGAPGAPGGPGGPGGAGGH